MSSQRSKSFKRQWNLEELKKELPKFVSSRKSSLMPREYAREVSDWCGASEHEVLQAVISLVQEGGIKLEDGRILVCYKPIPSARLVLSPDPEQNLHGWDLFRRLTDYYIECVKAEGSSSYSLWDDNDQTNYTFLSGRKNWYPRDGKSWEIFIADSAAESAVLQNISSSQDLCLGYPVYFRTVEDKDGNTKSVVTPVFCWHIRCEFLKNDLRGRSLSLQEQNNTPEINLDWLRYALKKKEQKRYFLESCGLFDFGNDDAADEGGTFNTHLSRWSVQNFSQLIEQMFHRKTAEPLDPDHLSEYPLTVHSKEGYYNKAVIFAPKPSPYTKGLISELEIIKNAPDALLDKTALKDYFFITDASSADSSLPLSSVLEISDFTTSQREAVASMMSSQITVMEGPPGTGKSHVVAGAALNQQFCGRSVLVSAFNHKAIDAVVERIEKIKDLGDGPFINRCNSPHQGAVEFTMGDAIEKILHSNDNPEAESEFKHLADRIKQEIGKRKALEEQANELHGKTSHLESLESQIRDLTEENPWLSDIPSVFSEEYLTPVNKAFQDFIASNGLMLKLLLQHPLTYTACKNWIREVGKKFDVSWPSLFQKPGEDFRTIVTQKTQTALDFLSKLEKSETIVKELSSAPKSAEAFSAEIAACTKRISKTVPSAFHELSEARMSRPKNGNRGLSSLKVALRDKDTGLENPLQFNSPDFEEPFDQLLKAFPAWAVSALSVRKFIPLTAGLFDLLLIDEATQSSIPNAIPLLFRAKRSAIIGDPQQLQYISGMRPDRDLILRKKFEIDGNSFRHFSYCDQSLYDMAVGTPGAYVVKLCDTFRSHSSIAAYSSANFYNGRLQVATDESRLKYPSTRKPGIHWIDIKGTVEPVPGGSCRCIEEAEQIVSELRAILINAEFGGTVGVVTPFNPQNKYIDTLVRERSGFSQELLDKANFLANTAHSFQGDERDVIILSLCGGEGLTPGCFNFIAQNPNIFNVAVSRARSTLIIVGNKEWAANCGIKHIASLTKDWSASRIQKKTRWYPYESPYEEKLAKALIEAGFDVKPQFKVMTRRLDLALIDGSAKLDIEVDSDTYHRGPDGLRKWEDTWRDEQLIRLGWKPLRIWTFEMRTQEDLDKCVDRVRNVWKTLKQKKA